MNFSQLYFSRKIIHGRVESFHERRDATSLNDMHLTYEHFNAHIFIPIRTFIMYEQKDVFFFWFPRVQKVFGVPFAYKTSRRYAYRKGMARWVYTYFQSGWMMYRNDSNDDTLATAPSCALTCSTYEKPSCPSLPRTVLFPYKFIYRLTLLGIKLIGDTTLLQCVKLIALQTRKYV